MSDFDDLFRERLNEEGQFPHQRRSWQQVSQRLEAFEAGQHDVSPRRASRWAKAAQWSHAAAWVLTAALVWQNVQLREQNQLLSTQLQTPPPVEPATGLPTGEVASVAVAPTLPTTAATASKGTSLPSVAPVERSVGEVFFRKKGIANSPAAQSASAASRATETNTTPSLSTNFEQKKSTESIAELLSAGMATEPTAVATSVPNIRVSVAATLPTTALRSDVQSIFSNKKIPLSASPALPIAAEAPTKTIDRSLGWLRAGVYVSGMRPITPNTGIRYLTGNGLALEAHTWRGLYVGARAEWLHFTAEGDSTLRGIHLPSAPINPVQGHQHHRIDYLKSTQRMQQYALGVRYVLPLRSRLRPSVGLSHTWVHLSDSEVLYEFTEPGHGGGHGGPGGPGGPSDPDPDYKVEYLDNQWVSNVWQASVGLDYELGRWVVGASATLSPAGDLFGTQALRAGVAYKF